MTGTCDVDVVVSIAVVEEMETGVELIGVDETAPEALAALLLMMAAR